jgi:hypothetical protein
LSPDVETENESSGYKAGELHAYVIDGDTEDGNKYRMYFKRFPHPKDQSLIMVVDRVEDSDNAINSFKVTPEFMDAMKVWQGDPYTIMKKRYEELGKAAVGKYLPESIFYSSEIIYHSILDFWFMDRYMKGHPEGLIVGASRTGKSEVGVVMSNFYGLGNVTEVNPLFPFPSASRSPCWGSNRYFERFSVSAMRARWLCAPRPVPNSLSRLASFSVGASLSHATCRAFASATRCSYRLWRVPELWLFFFFVWSVFTRLPE